MNKPNPDKLPRDWRRIIADLTGLHFCDEDCGCGENNQLWWWPTATGWRSLPKWLPGWTNGSDTHELWRWLVENEHAKLKGPTP